MVTRSCKKLAYKFYGPYEILERVGNAAYKLELLVTTLIHPVFHVSQLKEHVPNHTPIFSTLPAPLDLSASDVIPEKILDRKMVKRGNATHVQILVQRSTLPATSATWEDYEALKKSFPGAPAWGQAGAEEEGPVSTVAAALTSITP